MSKKSKLVSLLAVGAIAIGAVPVAIAASSPDKDGSNCAGKVGPGIAGAERGQFAKDLAAKLGGSTEQSVRSALKETAQSVRKDNDRKRPDQLTEEQRKAKGNEIVSTLAEKLGVSVDTLRTALTSLAKEHVAEAVKKGKISQAKADEITAKIDSGDAPLLPPHGPGGPGGPGGPNAPGGQGR